MTFSLAALTVGRLEKEVEAASRCGRKLIRGFLLHILKALGQLALAKSV